MSEASARLEGKVRDDLYQSPTGKRVFSVTDRRGLRVIVVTQSLQPVVGEQIALAGHWACEVGSGRCFVSEESRSPVPAGLPGAVRYLMDGLEIKFDTATQLLSQFGNRVFDLLDARDEKTLCAANLAISEVRAFLERWGSFRAKQASRGVLDRLKMSEQERIELVQKLGTAHDLDVELRKNPYMTLIHLKTVDFFLCDRLSRELNLGMKTKERRMGAILTVLRRRAKSGNTYMSGAALRSMTESLLRHDPTTAEWDEACKELIDRSLITFADDRCFLPEYFSSAASAARLLGNSREGRSDLDPPDDFEGMAMELGNTGYGLPAEHFDCVRDAISRQVSLLDARGPDAGLSFAQSYIRIMELLNVPYQVIVPTPWAAYQLRQACPEGHLGTAGALFGVNEEGEPNYSHVRSLNCSAVLVLGAEQLSLAAMCGLVENLGPSRSLLLCGDTEQDVGMVQGRPFSDLVEVEVHRPGWIHQRVLATVPKPQSPLAGLLKLKANPARIGELEGQLQLPVSYLDPGGDNLGDLLVEIATKLVPKLELGEPMAAMTVLASSVKIEPKPSELNWRLRECLNSQPASAAGPLHVGPGDPVVLSAPLSGTNFLPAGTRVQVESIHGEEGPVSGVAYGERVLIAGELLGKTTLAYVRGSYNAMWQQMPLVVLLLPDGGFPLPGRVLYTAAACAEKHLLVLGSRARFEATLKTEPPPRFSLFGAYLRDMLGIAEPPEKAHG